MTTPEDTLAALLREEADEVVPAGDGLAVIQKRLASRRRARWFLLPGAALVVGGAAAAVVVLSGGSGPTSLTQNPPLTQPPSPAVTETAAPTPTQTVTGGGLDHAFENPSVWPFHSAQDIARWQTTYPYADDKVKLVQNYVNDVLGVRGATYRKPCESCDVVDISVSGRKVGTAALERYLLDGAQVYTISAITGGDLKITSPTTGEAISSPTTVTGRITGVDEHVALTLLTDDAREVATGGAQAGSAVPWTTQITWFDSSWTHAGLVAKTFSPKDGALNRLAVLPVDRGAPSASAASTFAGIRMGRVELFDAVSGNVVKHLTYPPNGTADVSASYRQGSLLWVRTASSGCTSSINRLTGGKASTVEAAGAYRFRDVRLSPDGSTWAFLRQPCNGTSYELVVRGAASWQRTVDPQTPEVYDVADDGTVLYLDKGTHYVGTASARTALRPDGGCGLQAGLLDADGTASAWEACTGEASLKNFDRAGRITSTGAPAFEQVYEVTRSAQGLLVVASPQRGAQPAVYRLDTSGEGLDWVEVVKGGTVTSVSW